MVPLERGPSAFAGRRRPISALHRQDGVAVLGCALHALEQRHVLALLAMDAPEVAVDGDGRETCLVQEIGDLVQA